MKLGEVTLVDENRYSQKNSGKATLTTNTWPFPQTFSSSWLMLDNTFTRMDLQVISHAVMVKWREGNEEWNKVETRIHAYLSECWKVVARTVVLWLLIVAKRFSCNIWIEASRSCILFSFRIKSLFLLHILYILYNVIKSVNSDSRWIVRKSEETRLCRLRFMKMKINMAFWSRLQWGK